jgi:hypothetical protein
MAELLGFEVESTLKGAFICGSGGAARMDTMSANSADSAKFAAASRVPRMTRGWLAILLLMAVAWDPAWAGGRDDHDRARAAVQSGEVLPLPTVLERLQRSHPGEVFDVELEREDGRWIYEMKLLQSGGKLIRLELDARTAEVLESKPAEKKRNRSGVPR